MTTSVEEVAGIAPAVATAKEAAAPIKPLATESGFHSGESERMVISLMLNERRADVHHKLMALLAADDFYIEQHQVIWGIIRTLRDEGLPADPVALIDYAATKKSFVGGPAYVVEAVNDPIAKMCSDETGLAAASRVKDFALVRRLQTVLQRATSLCANGQSFEQIAGLLEDDLTNLKLSRKTSRKGPEEMRVYYDAILAQMDAKDAGLETTNAVSTGYPELDDVLGGGLMVEGVIVLAGRPGMGKSAFATAIEQNISGRGRATLTFSLEMPGKQVAQRKLSSATRIPLKRVKSVDFSGDDEYSRLAESIDFLSKRPCFIDDSPGLTISEIRSRARTFASVHPDLVIFVDYMQIIASANPKADSRMAVTEASKGLLQIARELKCPVVALAQLNRDLEKRSNRRPVMADLKESGQIEQDAAVIVFLYRDEIYNPDSPDRGITEAIVGKNRDGATDTLKFSSDLATMSYHELSRYGGRN